jgi:hypothetical protein
MSYTSFTVFFRNTERAQNSETGIKILILVSSALFRAPQKDVSSGCPKVDISQRRLQ